MADTVTESLAETANDVIPQSESSNIASENGKGSPAKTEDTTSSTGENGEAPVITEAMKEEEAKLHEETVKEEEERKKQTEMELHQMDEEQREQRYKRLQFLLTKSNMYTHYLLRRMQKQREIDEKQRKQREQRRARKAKGEKVEGEDAENTTGETEPNTNENTEATDTTATDSTQTNDKTSKNSTATEKTTKEEEKTEDSALSSLDTTAPEQEQRTRRQSPRGSPAVTGRRTTRSGKPSIASPPPVKAKKGQKRKAETESYKITDMFAEALDRNKRRKKEEEASSQDEKENGEKKENETKEEKENTKKESPKSKGEQEPKDYGRYINGEAVPDCQPLLFSGGVLRDYQIEGYRWLKVLYENGVNGILADEMGLGKTIQCIAVIASLVYKGLVGPYLIVGPLSTVPNWVAEFKKFAPKVPVILYHGSQDTRHSLRKKMVKLYPIRPGVEVHPVVVTSYEIAMNDRKFIGNFPWKYIIVDEGHRIKNFQCRLIKELKMYQSTHRLLLTGTPLQNNLQELWSLLNFLLPEIFDDLGSFESWFDLSFLETDSSNEAIVLEEQRNSILTMLHQILSPFMLRRVKTDVELDIPPKREVLVYAPLSTAQTRQYRTIVDKTIRRLVEGDEEKERASFEVDAHGRSRRNRRSRYSKETLSAIMAAEPAEKKRRATEDDEEEDEDIKEWFKVSEDMNNNSGKCPQAEPKSHELKVQLRNTMFMLRKCCNHPYLIEYPLTASGDYRIDEELISASGKIMLLDKMLKKLKADGHKVLIFSQMTQMMNILEDYCYYRKYKYCRLDGSMKIEDRTDQISDFNKDPEMFVFLLSTRAGGLGINLTAADTCIIFDSDWNPQCDLQAQDRCHRIGQRRPVMVYRLITARTIDQKIVERAAAKRKLEKMVITQGKFKSGGCWVDEEAAKNVPDEQEDLRQHGKKVTSALSAAELLQLLQSTDFDEKHEAGEGEAAVISEKDLERLLDRSDLWKRMKAKKDGSADSTPISTPRSSPKRTRGKKEEGAYKDVEGVFKVMEEDMGGSTLDAVKEIQQQS